MLYHLKILVLVVSSCCSALTLSPLFASSPLFSSCPPSVLKVSTEAPWHLHTYATHPQNHVPYFSYNHPYISHMYPHFLCNIPTIVLEMSTPSLTTPHLVVSYPIS